MAPTKFYTKHVFLHQLRLFSKINNNKKIFSFQRKNEFTHNASCLASKVVNHSILFYLNLQVNKAYFCLNLQFERSDNQAYI